MSESLARWVIAERTHAAYAAALVGVVTLLLLILLLFTAWVPGAFVAFLVLSGRSAWALEAAALTTLPTLLVVALAGTFAGAFGLVAALILPAVLGIWVMQRTRSLNLAVQTLILVGVAVPVLAHLSLADPSGVFKPLLAEMDHILRERAVFDAERSVSQIGRVMWGTVGLLVMLHGVFALMVGLYWSSRITGQAELGPRFRQLRTGKVLCVLFLLLMGFGMARSSGLAISMLLPISGGLILQALALLHWAQDSYQFNGWWLASAYVALFALPLAQILGPVIGFLDNWLPLRERLMARRGGR